MAPPAPIAKPLVIRARPETLVLVATVTAMTFALSNAIHSRRDAQREVAPSGISQPQQQAWAGDLADVSAPVASGGGESMSSASLVVPKSVLALPSVAMRPLVRLRGCEGSICAAKASAPTPMRRPASVAAVSAPHPVAARHKESLVARLNPLRHLPDMKAIGKPFTYAGNAVTGWFRSF